MATDIGKSDAEILKAQGNELHRKGQYSEARHKYTDAIKYDPTNAILYANRAACSLALKEFLDASADATKATELDPKYAKAWSRLGSACYGLSAWSKSINAWEIALTCLPPQEEATEADNKLRIQFTEGLKKAQKEKDAPVSQEHMHYFNAGQQMPWAKAAALEQQLISEQQVSSGFVILRAYEEFKEAVDVMKQLHQKNVNGAMAWVGKPDVLVNITNGIMRDPRVFHFDCTDWIDKFNNQVIFEAQFFKAWAHGGAKTVKDEALKRLAQEGWDSVRPALSTTLRAWIMCGFLANSTGKFQTAMEYYSRVVDVLDWGLLTWQNVPNGDRGAIFEKTFVRGVKRLRLETMRSCIGNKEQNLNFTLGDIAKTCRAIIAETDANPPEANNDLDVGFVASFWMYPKGEALSTLGWYYMQLGHAANDINDAQNAYTRATELYIQSAETHPPDDEAVLVFYAVALEGYWYQPQGARLEDMLPLVLRLTLSIPKVLRFWEHSALSRTRDMQVQQALEFGLRCQKALDEGQLTLDSLVRPKIMVFL